MYDAVIFDNDGVLVEPPREATLRAAVREAFAACGVPDPDPADVSAVSGGATADVLDRTGTDYGVDPGEFWRVRDERFTAAQRTDVESGAVSPYPDAVVVHGVDCPAAVVSSNQRAAVEFMHGHFGFDDRFVSTYGRRPGLADVERKKPDPYFLHRAVADIEAHLGAPPERTLMVGDGESDVRAARNAGIDAAYLDRPHRDGAPSVSPDHLLDGLDDLRPLLAE